MSGERRKIVATCVPGLEDVAARELEESAWAEEVRPGRGKVRFATSAPLEELFGLRSVEYLHLWLGPLALPQGPEAEEAAYEQVRALDLAPYLEGLRTLRELPGRPSFRVTGEREGKQSWGSMDLQRWAGQAIVDRWGLPVDLEGHDLEIVVRSEWKGGWVAGRLHRESLRRRPYGVRLHWAALNPLIAYGMVRLGGPRPGERVHDPFCGSGTIPIEGALFAPGVRWSGSDWDGSALFMASENAREAGVALPLARADAQRLPLAAGSVDLILGNLPFGRRSGSHRKNRRLYRGFLRELTRVLPPGGRAVILTLERRLMLELLEGSPLEMLDDRILTHGGLNPRLYTLHASG